MLTPCDLCDVTPALIKARYDNFLVVADPYPIAPGHLMIVAKEHYGCVGELPDALMEELSEISSAVERVLRDITGECIFYEHGRSGTCAGISDGISCYHMHLHALPVHCDIHQSLETRFSFREVEGVRELARWFHGYGEYLYFRGSDRKHRCYLVRGRDVESHLLRSLVAHEIDRPDLHDWENYSDQEMIAASFEMLEGAEALLSAGECCV